MRQALLSLALCGLASATALPARADTLGQVDTTGASATLPALSWGRLQARLAFATTATPLRTDFQGVETAFKVSSLSLMGDYYLRPSLSQLTLGGLRATGGLMLGQRNGLWGLSSPQIGTMSAERRNASASHDPYNPNYTEFSTTPYLGIGYSGTSATFGRSGNWGFTADLGLMSLSPSALGRVGRVAAGSQNLDDMVRDLRLSPVLQLGFSYSF
jgi:hypothetical protein